MEHRKTDDPNNVFNLKIILYNHWAYSVLAFSSLFVNFSLNVPRLGTRVLDGLADIILEVRTNGVLL